MLNAQDRLYLHRKLSSMLMEGVVGMHKPDGIRRPLGYVCV